MFLRHLIFPTINISKKSQLHAVLNQYYFQQTNEQLNRPGDAPVIQYLGHLQKTRGLVGILPASQVFGTTSAYLDLVLSYNLT